MAHALVILLGLGTLAFVLAPLFRSDATAAELAVDTRSDERDLHAQHEMVLASLKDLEDDRATEKIDDADYDELKASLTAQAVDTMKRLDAARETRHEREQPGPRLVGPDE